MRATILTAIALAALVAADTCTLDSCTTNCQAYDAIVQNCTDTKSLGFDSNISCYCEGTYGLTTDTGILNLCVACNQQGLGAFDLDIYQLETVVCDVYDSSGEAAAVSIASQQATDVIALYSSVALPIIQSGLCTNGAFTTTSVAASQSTPTVVASQVGGLVSTKLTTTASLPASTSIPKAATLIPGVLSSSGAAAITSQSTTTTQGATAAAASSAVSSRAAAPRKWQPAGLALMVMPIVGALV